MVNSEQFREIRADFPCREITNTFNQRKALCDVVNALAPQVFDFTWPTLMPAMLDGDQQAVNDYARELYIERGVSMEEVKARFDNAPKKHRVADRVTMVYTQQNMGSALEGGDDVTGASLQTYYDPGKITVRLRTVEDKARAIEAYLLGNPFRGMAS